MNPREKLLAIAHRLESDCRPCRASEEIREILPFVFDTSPANTGGTLARSLASLALECEPGPQRARIEALAEGVAHVEIRLEVQSAQIGRFVASMDKATANFAELRGRARPRLD